MVYIGVFEDLAVRIFWSNMNTVDPVAPSTLHPLLVWDTELHRAKVVDANIQVQKIW